MHRILAGLHRVVKYAVDLLPNLVFENLGWLSGILMVLPNGMVALYYAKSRRADVVYTSQIGDGHICIPMCIGLFALFKTIQVPPHLNLSVSIIIGISTQPGLTRHWPVPCVACAVLYQY